MYWYARNTRPTRRGGSTGLIVFGLLMVAVQLTVFFGSPPKSDTEVAISALAAYVLFAAIAFWLERRRAPNS
jgi:hypothetical protein